MLARTVKTSRGELQSLLRHLEKKGTVDRIGNRYYAARRENIHRGRFRRKLSGSGQVSVDLMADDIVISRREAMNLVDGDVVDVVAYPDAKNQLKGTIKAIHTRRQEPITGYYRRSASGPVVQPLDPRLSGAIAVPELSVKHATSKVVIVSLDPACNPADFPSGKVIRILGDRFAFGVQTTIITLKFGVRDEIPEAVQQEAERLITEARATQSSGRIDLRSVLTITVDPINARDFDDALSLETCDGVHRLGVHIADVSHYVPRNTSVDHEAYLRGTSVYLPERAIHMLPEALATDVCSLKPLEDRLAVSVFITIDETGHIIGGDIFESTIRSDARLTYEQFLAAATMDPADTSTQAGCLQEIPLDTRGAVRDLCISLSSICHKLVQRRVQRGALDLDMPEAFFELDASGQVCGIHKKKRSIAEQTIEEFMIAANVVVAEFLSGSAIPYLRRTHEPPDVDEITELKAAIAQLGIAPPQNPLDPDQVRALLAGIDNSAIRSVISQRILRAMKRAVYSATSSGHFGLALDHYTQFTSPIRRYPDLEVHRSLKCALKIPGYSTGSVEQLTDRAKHLSECERRAQEAEWEAQKIEKIRFMTHRIGKEYPGTVTQVMEYGAYIELDEPFIDGFIPVATLDEFYRFNPVGNTLSNPDGSMILKPGKRVIIRVAVADLDRGMLDFHLVRPASPDPSA